MSMAIAHFALGAAITTLLVTFLVPGLPYPRVVVFLGGVWAMVPDAHWFAPVFGAELQALHRSPVADLFFLHRRLDVLDVTDSREVAALLVGAWFLTTVVAERRDYRALAALRRQRAGDPTEPES